LKQVQKKERARVKKTKTNWKNKLKVVLKLTDTWHLMIGSFELWLFKWYTKFGNFSGLKEIISGVGLLVVEK